MKRANCSSKGKVVTIEDDETASEQSVSKSVKIEVLEESAPDLAVSEPANREMPVEQRTMGELEAEVAELKQQLQKKEDMFQGACRYAREFELRAERAENLLESKQGILENAKTTEELKIEHAKNTEELKKRIEELSCKLAEYEEASHSIQQLQQKAIQAEKREEELKKSVLDVTSQMNAEIIRANGDRKRALEDRMRDQKRIAELLKEREEERDALLKKQQHIDSLLKQNSTVKDELMEDQNLNLSLKKKALKEKQTKEELEQSMTEMSEQMEEERRRNSEEKKKILDESEKEKEELRSRLREMEKQMSELIGSVPILNANPMDGNEERRELSEEGREEPMEMIEMGEQMEDPFYDNNSSKTAEMERRRKSSRNVSRSLKYADLMEESDDEEEPSVKKGRSESVEKKEKDIPQKRMSNSKSVKKENEEKDNDMEKNELECPECEYRSRSVNAWILHLRLKHSTKPDLAGCLLRCDCGHESYSYKHSLKCEISNFTVIRTGDGIIRRLTDPVMTPQCVLCKEFPKTVNGYTEHLNKHHKTTLPVNGIYLQCACGFRCRNNYDHKNHDKKCNGRDYTLHKLEDD